MVFLGLLELSLTVSSEDDVLGRVLLKDWLVSDSEQVEQVSDVESWVFGRLLVFFLFFVCLGGAWESTGVFLDREGFGLS